MCGITGWVDFKKQLVQEKQTMDRMTDTLSKRGPDDSNVWGGAPCFIRT
ncbi:asparagine synthetase [Bacillus subtilis]|nr:asparagine synthetase [Bacillus subtilis]